MLLYVGAHGITLQSFATNAGTAATNNCQCSISSGACQSVPYGCMHGMLLKIQGSNNWNSPVIQFTTLYSEETSATPPICEGTTTSSQKLGCVLHAESTGQFQMTVTNSGDSTPIEIVMNVTAPEFIIVEQVTESSCRGAPGIALLDCYHGAEIKIEHVGMDVFTGTYYAGEATFKELVPEMQFSAGGAECLQLTIDSTHVICSLGVNAETVGMMLLTLKPRIRADTDFPAEITGQPFHVFHAKGITFDGYNYLNQGNITIQTRLPIINSISGDCASLQQQYNPHIFTATQCVHGGIITLHGQGLLNVNLTWSSLTNSDPGPTCFIQEAIGTSAIVCHTDLTSSSNELGTYELIATSTVYKLENVTFVTPVTTPVRASFQTPALSSMAATDCMVTDNSLGVAGCYGMYPVTIYGRGFYKSNPAFNTLTFTSADGATPTPAAVCNSVSMSQVICELEVPRDVAYAKTWTLGVNIIGYVVTSELYIRDAFPQSTSYPLPVAFASAVAVDGRLMVAGGEDSNANAVTTVRTYDPETNSAWGSTVAQLPVARACATAVGVPDITATNSSVRWMYLMGGTKDTDNSTSCLNGKQGDREVYAYDTNLDTWTKLDDRIPALSRVNTLNMSNTGSGLRTGVFMFDVVVEDDVVISGLDVANGYVGSDEWSVYYRAGTYYGYENISSAWVLVTKVKTEFSETGQKPLPANFEVKLQAGGLHGGRYGFYVACTAAGGVCQDGYRDTESATVPTGSPEMTIYPGKYTAAMWSIPDPLFYGAQFAGAFKVARAAESCLSFTQFPNAWVSGQASYTYQHAFWLDKTAQVSTAEFTLQLYVDGNYSNATELGIDLIKDNGEILSLTDNAHLDFWWNTSSVEYYKFTDMASVDLTMSGTFPVNEVNDLLSAFQVKPDRSLLNFFEAPINAGSYKVVFKDMHPGNPNRFLIKGFELRLCNEQPGVVAAASALIDDKVYIVGGVSSGAFVYENPQAQAIANPGSVEATVNAHGFGAIQSLKIGVQATTVHATNAKLRLTVPPIAQRSIVGEWMADGTLFDVSAYGRHATIPSVNQYAWVYDSGCTTTGYPQVNLSTAYLVVPWMQKSQVETRAVWIKMHEGDTGNYAIMGFGNVRHLWRYSTLFVHGGYLKFMESGGLGMSCVITPTSGNAINDGAWHHVAMTRDASNLITFYIDGIAHGGGTCTTAHVPAVDFDEFSIGVWHYKQFIKEVIDAILYDARVYDRALSRDEIVALKMNGCGGQVTDIITTDVAATSTEFGLQTFEVGGLTLSSSVFPASDPNITFAPAGELRAVTSAVGGKWRLTYENSGAPAGTLVNWAIQVIGTQQFASSGTAVFGVTGSNPSGQSFKALERPRYGHVLVAVGSKLYAIGGSEGPTTTHEALGTMEIMDTSHLTPEWTGGASMQYARFMPAATAVGQTIYVVGGYGSSGTLLTNMEKYDILTNTWTVITTNAKYYQSLVYGRWGAFSANIHNRLYVGTGIDSSNMARNTVDSVDVQTKEDCWLRQNDTDFMIGCGCDQLSPHACNQPGYNYEAGSFYFGQVAAEGDCASKCASEKRCNAFTYYATDMRCYGRIGVGHNCTSAIGVSGASSGVKFCDGDELLLQTSGNLGTHAIQYTMFDVLVATGVSVQLDAMTLELAKADDQIVYVRHHTGSYTTGSVWTTDLTNGGTTITPVSVGTYRLQFATPITLTAGVHAFYIAMAVPASLYFTPAAVPSQDKYITMLQGGESASAYALPTTQVGMPNAVLHLTKVSAWSPHTVRTSCFTSTTLNMTKDVAGLGLSRWGLPVNTEGFSIFARIYSTSPTSRSGLFCKAPYGTAGVEGGGGFAISLWGGSLRFSTLNGWVPFGPSIAPDTWYNLQVSYDGVSAWVFIVNDKEYTAVAIMPKQSALSDLVVGSECGSNAWQGGISDVSIDCSGPTIDLATVFPNVGREGVLSQDEQHVKFYFSDDIVPVGGNVYFTTSVLDGLYDKSVIGTTAVDIFNSSVSIVGNMVEIQIPSNFSYGVRYQMSMDIGVVRFASDAGGYQGMIYREPEAGEWWFKVSDQYHTSTCAGGPCAVCNACRYQYTRGSGDKVYRCYINTERAGLIEVQRLNVELLPTVDCP